MGYAALNLIEGLSDNIQWCQLKDNLTKGKKSLDARISSEFQSGRLKVDTIHIPLSELWENLDEPDKNQAYIAILQRTASSRQDLPSKALMALIHNIKWLIQKESNMETSISMADFYEKYLNENLNLIDVREVHEFQAGHAPGARNLPLSTLEQGYKELKPDHAYHVICQGGVRSASACEFLSAQGLTVINVEGGMNAWPGQVE